MADTAVLASVGTSTLPEATELARRALDVPAELILQLAIGMEDAVAVAGRFGFTEEEFGALSQWQPFRDQVAAKQAELKQSGYTFRLQNAFFAEDVGKDLYMLAKSNDVPFSQKLDAYRTFTKFAGLEPQAQSQNIPGTGFSVNIVFNEAPTKPVEKVVVEAPE